MTKRITAALLALCLALALAACGKGSEPELNIDELGEELYAAGTFGETLYPLDESVAQGLYGTDADTRCWVRAARALPPRSWPSLRRRTPTPLPRW